MKPTTDRPARPPGNHRRAATRRRCTWQISRRQGAKRSYSANNGCVEIAFVDDGGVAVRDSKDRSGSVLIFQPHEWAAFVRGVGAGEFDPSLTIHY
jgi:Domain of unknown function (DUF397)